MRSYQVVKLVSYRPTKALLFLLQATGATSHQSRRGAAKLLRRMLAHKMAGLAAVSTELRMTLNGP